MRYYNELRWRIVKGSAREQPENWLNLVGCQEVLGLVDCDKMVGLCEPGDRLKRKLNSFAFREIIKAEKYLSSVVMSHANEHSLGREFLELQILEVRE
jgi:hypothetical protein